MAATPTPRGLSPTPEPFRRQAGVSPRPGGGRRSDSQSGQTQDGGAQGSNQNGSNRCTLNNTQESGEVSPRPTLVYTDTDTVEDLALRDSAHIWDSSPQDDRVEAGQDSREGTMSSETSSGLGYEVATTRSYESDLPTSEVSARSESSELPNLDASWWSDPEEREADRAIYFGALALYGGADDQNTSDQAERIQQVIQKAQRHTTILTKSQLRTIFRMEPRTLRRIADCPSDGNGLGIPAQDSSRGTTGRKNQAASPPASPESRGHGLPSATTSSSEPQAEAKVGKGGSQQPEVRENSRVVSKAKAKVGAMEAARSLPRNLPRRSRNRPGPTVF